MYSGRMIEEILQSVERAEDHALRAEQLSLLKTVQDQSGFATHIYERVERTQPVGRA